MKWYRDENTGKVAKYPEDFAAIFPTLVEIDSDEAACQDCMVQPEPEPVEDEGDLEEFAEIFSGDDDEKDED